MTQRPNTTRTGETSSTATLISRYGMPQISDTATNSTQPRRLTCASPPSSRLCSPVHPRPPPPTRPSGFPRSAAGGDGGEALQGAADAEHGERPDQEPAELPQVAVGQVEPLGPGEGRVFAAPLDLEDARPADGGAGVVDLHQPGRIPLRDDHRVQDPDVPAAGKRQPGPGGQPAVQALRRSADGPDVGGQHPLTLALPVGEYGPRPLRRGVDVDALDELRHAGAPPRRSRRLRRPARSPA